MSNAEIAAHIDELGDLYELDGAVVYRVVAYRKAAQTIRDWPVSVEKLARDGRLTELPGIGTTLEEKIVALLDGGEIPAARKLRARHPPGLIDIMRVPGLGAKRARRLFEDLGVASIDELRRAAEGRRLRDVSGFGPKAEQNVLDALRARPVEAAGERVLLSRALEVAEQIVVALRAHPAAERVEIAGSARRMCETCKDVDLIASARDPAALVGAFTALPVVADVLGSGDSGGRVLTHSGLQIDLRVVPPAQHGNLWQHFTGSKRHNVALREHAVKRGLHVSEHGIADDASGETRVCETEAGVYEALGLAYVEPELREDRGEIEAAERRALPDLVGYGDIAGELHCHTTLSDGRNTLEEMVDAAGALGYRYLAVTDHSATHGFGNNVPADELARQIERVRALDETLPRLRVLIGSEVNIRADGKLDYPDDLLQRLDWVIAAIHTSFRMGEGAMTDRIVAAMEHPLVDALAHPTGRLLLARPPYEVDVERLIECAARTGTLIEINANPERRDLPETFVRLAGEAAAAVFIGTDAHSTGHLEFMRYGIATARRGWLRADQVANTRPWAEVERLRPRNRR